MFTGIIAAIGHVQTLTPKGGDVSIAIAMPSLDLNDVILGDSIAINGVCLTVVDIQQTVLSFDVSNETLSLTSLGSLTTGAAVNLEKALAVGERLGGHFVSGHIDGMAECTQLTTEGRSTRYRFTVPEQLTRYIAQKGSICIDGVSLTVNAAEQNWFEVNIIPHTMQETIIHQYKVGSQVNIEVDLIARYLERLIPGQDNAGITMATLQEHGYTK